MPNLVSTECTECHLDVTVDVDRATVTARISSNGKRGSLHVPAHDATIPGYADDDLVYWECPQCEHAESTYVCADLRADLA